jgi:HSP20 family protein
MLTRWDPFQEMITLRNAVDRLFDSTYGTSSTGQPATWGLALDVLEQEDEFLVKASVPGINPDDLEITFTDNMLSVN